MKSWEHIINTAILGTDKPMPGNTELPHELAEAVSLIEAVESSDKEAKFLQKAAAIYNYRVCGFTPPEQKDLQTKNASPEIKPYCPEAAAAVLNDILNEDNNALLYFWLSCCNKNEQLLLPEFLPRVLDAALKDKFLQPMVIACSGNRGVWLSELNKSWDYFGSLSDEEIWQTGKHEERVNVLKKLRQTNPEQAREWLQQTWPQETAASKIDLLKTLRINAGGADLEWGESLLNEKGQKVKDEVLALLKLIPGSSILNQYQDLLKGSVILKKEKALLGMMTKTSIQQKLPDKFDESIFKSGIEKLAGQKSAFTDEEYIIYQLISAVPPVFWEKQFETTPQQVVINFEKYAPSMITALAMAVSNFKEESWMPLFLHLDGFYVDFINFLPGNEQEKYLLRFVDRDAQNTIHFALKLNREWSMEFAKKSLRVMANYPYEYNRAFFSKNIGYIPAGIAQQIGQIAPNDPNLLNAWGKNRDHLIKLLHLKQQTLKAFNA